MIIDRLRSAFSRSGTVARAVAEAPRSVRLLGLSMVKNEQDVIEPFLRHHAALLDTIVLLDNASIDHTRAIALACARELNNIVIGDSPEFSFLQSERMSRLLETCQAAFEADYVFFLDADEFLSAPDRDSLIAGLQPIPSGGAGLLSWQTFVIRPGEEDSVAANPPSSFTHRRRVEQPPFSKVVLRLDRAPAAGLTIAQGHHTAMRGGVDLQMVPLDSVRLLHFPVRSDRQITTKSVVGWTACVARDPGARGKNTCFQWRDAFDRLTDGGRAALKQELSVMSFGYAQDPSIVDWEVASVADPPPVSPTRRHSDGGFADPLTLIARSWERSLAVDAVGPALDRLAPVRFLAELREPARALLIGGQPEAVVALLDTLGIPCVTAPSWNAASGYGPFDLAIQLKDDGSDPAPLDHLRILILPGSTALDTDLQRWVKHGYAPSRHDTGGVRALGIDEKQQKGAVVLTRSKLAGGRPSRSASP